MTFTTLALALLSVGPCQATLRLARPRAPLAFHEWQSAGALTCTSLTNHGTHFTARIEVGTPPQPFDVVADTGSDSVIITSCLCREKRHCNVENKCFTGTNKSSSFLMRSFANDDRVPVVVLTFGSGQIEAVISTDVVRVGTVTANMSDGLLLMVNQALRLSGPFEGILGLGLPRHQQPTPAAPAASASKQVATIQLPHPASPPMPKWPWFPAPKAQAPKKPSVTFAADVHEVTVRDVESPAASINFHPNSTDEDIALPSIDAVVVGGPRGPPAPADAPQDAGIYTARGFLETAGVTRFSMCFNDGADGVLRLATPQDPNALGSIGQVHWGLDLRGFSVGKKESPALFCGPNTAMRPGQDTPCGAIPDSGTTVMMGPAEHIKLLFNELCNQWSMCKDALAGELRGQPAHEVLQIMLMRCGDWMGEKGLSVLPSIHLHLRGSGGRDRTLEIPASTYIIETMAEEAHYVTKHLMGIFPVKVAVPSGHKRKVCAPAFGTQEYNTAKNGPVWILGTPLFYEFQVGYDMQSSPPSISFNEAPCGSCSHQTALFAESHEVAKANASAATRTRRNHPREIHGPLLVRELDPSLPL